MSTAMNNRVSTSLDGARVKVCLDNVTLALVHLEERLDSFEQKTMERLEQVITSGLEQMETRLNKKLTKIVNASLLPLSSSLTSHAQSHSTTLSAHSSSLSQLLKGTEAAAAAFRTVGQRMEVHEKRRGDYMREVAERLDRGDQRREADTKYFEKLDASLCDIEQGLLTLQERKEQREQREHSGSRVNSTSSAKVFAQVIPSAFTPLPNPPPSHSHSESQSQSRFHKHQGHSINTVNADNRQSLAIKPCTSTILKNDSTQSALADQITAKISTERAMIIEQDDEPSTQEEVELESDDENRVELLSARQRELTPPVSSQPRWGDTTLSPIVPDAPVAAQASSPPFSSPLTPLTNNIAEDYHTSTSANYLLDRSPTLESQSGDSSPEQQLPPIKRRRIDQSSPSPLLIAPSCVDFVSHRPESERKLMMKAGTEGVTGKSVGMGTMEQMSAGRKRRIIQQDDTESEADSDV